MLDTKKITTPENLEIAAEIVLRLSEADGLSANQTVSLQTKDITVEFNKQLPSKYDKLTYDFSFLIKNVIKEYRLYGSKVAGKLSVTDLDISNQGSNSFENYFKDDFDTEVVEIYSAEIRKLTEVLERDLADTLKQDWR